MKEYFPVFEIDSGTFIVGDRAHGGVRASSRACGRRCRRCGSRSPTRCVVLRVEHMANTFHRSAPSPAMNVRNIPQRWASSLVAVVGIGGVTLVLIAVLSIAAGFKAGARSCPGRQDVAIILRSGSTNEMSSGFGQDTRHRHQRCAGHQARSRMRKPHGSLARALRADRGRMRGKDASANLPFRGVSADGAAAAQDASRSSRARMMRDGTNEIIVGDGVVRTTKASRSARQCAGATRTGTIVGRFTR